MGNTFRLKDIKNCTYFFFENINIKNLDPNKIKIDEKSYKNILICRIGYLTVKNLRYIKVNNVNPLFLIIIKINVYIEESNGKKYLTLVPTDKNKYIRKIYKKLRTKIKDCIGSRTNKSDDYDEKYMKIKFNSDYDLPLKKTLKLRNMIVAARFFLLSAKFC